VSGPSFEPFDQSHITVAAALLADRHRAHRLREPLLPESPDFASLVAAELENGTGAVAFVDGEMAGFLIGKRGTDAIGPHIWSKPEGHAVREPDLVRDLYTHGAATWVEEGFTRHFVFAPADPVLLEPWYRLSFGASAAFSLRESAPSTDCDTGTAPGVTLRLSTPDDLPAIARLARALETTLQAPPSFSFMPSHTEDELAAEWSDLWDPGQGFVHFVAENSRQIVGHTLLYRRPVDLRVSDNSIDLANAATDPRCAAPASASP
jgi:hypothetical protein